MLRVSGKLTIRRPTIVLLAALFTASVADSAPGQRTRAPQPGEEVPVFQEYRGVKLGTPADEVRKRLGNPKDKSDEQDFFVFGETETIQIVYDKLHSVSTLSVDFLSGAKEIPTPRAVLGADMQAKPDGSMYRMVRYPKAGYWVSYNRTSGDSPLITVTIQKIEH